MASSHETYEAAKNLQKLRFAAMESGADLNYQTDAGMNEATADLLQSILTEEDFFAIARPHVKKD